MDLAKEWEKRQKRKFAEKYKAGYAKPRKDYEALKKKSKDRKKTLKTSIGDLIPEETLQKLLEI